MGSQIVILIVAFCGLIILQMIFFLTRYKRVPPNKLLIIFGRVSNDPNEQVKIERSGGHFVWPVIQEFAFIDLKVNEYSIEINSQDSNNQFVNLAVALNVATGDTQTLVSNYLKRFKGESEDQIVRQVQALADSVVKNFILGKRKDDLQLNLAKTEFELSSEVKVALGNLGMELISLSALEIK